MDSGYEYINSVWGIVVAAVTITVSVLLFQGITASDELNANYKLKCIEAGGNYVLVDDGSIYACELSGKKVAE